jgi:predicted anti-sigma-YlaC factor YlaD
MRSIPSDECTRACEWVSLRLDDQLSDFESVLLEAHLARCSDCGAFARSVTEMTTALRTAPLEQASVDVRVLHRSAGRFLGLRAVSAAAVAAVVGLSGLVSLELSNGRAPSPAVHFDRNVIGLKDRQLQELDSAGRRTPPAIAPGLAAAEQVNVGNVVGIGPAGDATGKIPLQTATAQTEGR